MRYPKTPRGLRLINLIIVAALLLVGIITFSLAELTRSAYRQQITDQYYQDTQTLSTAFGRKLDGYVDLLYDARAFIRGSEEVTPSEWTGYFHDLDVFNRYKGFSAIFYIDVIPNSQKQTFIVKKRLDPKFGPSFDINPSGNRDSYGVATLSISSNNIKLEGFDVFSTAGRKAVYDKALETGLPTVSPYLEFSTGHDGVFMVMPLSGKQEDGFVALSLRGEDFFEEIFSPEDLKKTRIKISDISEKDKSVEMYKSYGWHNSTDLQHSDTLGVGGRTWKIDYDIPQNYAETIIGIYLPILILVVGLVVVGVLAAGFSVYVRAAHRNIDTVS